MKKIIILITLIFFSSCSIDNNTDIKEIDSLTLSNYELNQEIKKLKVKVERQDSIHLKLVEGIKDSLVTKYLETGSLTSNVEIIFAVSKYSHFYQPVLYYKNNEYLMPSYKLHNKYYSKNLPYYIILDKEYIDEISEIGYGGQGFGLRYFYHKSEIYPDSITLSKSKIDHMLFGTIASSKKKELKLDGKYGFIRNEKDSLFLFNNVKNLLTKKNINLSNYSYRSIKTNKIRTFFTPDTLLAHSVIVKNKLKEFSIFLLIPKLENVDPIFTIIDESEPNAYYGEFITYLIGAYDIDNDNIEEFILVNAGYEYERLLIYGYRNNEWMEVYSYSMY